MTTVECRLHVVDAAGNPIQDATAAVVRASRPMPEIGFQASEKGEIVVRLPLGSAVLAVFGPGGTRTEVQFNATAHGASSFTVVLS
jgi:hypothetical protein